jgi:hypothetical protein
MHDRIELPEHAAVLHLLSAPALWPRTAAYVSDGDFDWAGLFAEAETMSGGEALLVRIAHELWSASKDVGCGSFRAAWTRTASPACSRRSGSAGA